MVFDVIRGILNSPLSEDAKLRRIAKIVDKFDAIGMQAVEDAVDSGIEPTWEDRINLLKQAAIKQSEERSDGLQDDIIDSVEHGIAWLKRRIMENQYWDVPEVFEPIQVKEEPEELTRPLEMLNYAPWEISMTILVLADWLNHWRKNDQEAMEVIEKGKAYLRHIQNGLGEGGLGDSLWLEEIPSRDDISLANVPETAISISAFNASAGGLTRDYTGAADEAISYLIACRDKDDGAWGFKKGLSSDLKCTAIALMSLMATRIRRKIASLSDYELDEILYKGLKWLLGQQENGDWSYHPRASRDNVVFGSFYAIELLAQVRIFVNIMSDRFNLEGLAKLEKELQSAFWHSLRQYEVSQKLITDEEHEGWGWGSEIGSLSVENTAAALIVLLDAEWLDATSPMLERASEWLLQKMDMESFWGVDTPLVIMAFIRMIQDTARLSSNLERLRLQY